MEHTNRKFGIEIEFVGACKYEVAEAINAAGVECQVEYYNHITQPHWKIVTDSSLDSIRGHAAELVSPILQGSNGVAELKNVIDALNSVDGVTVNRSCGLHVHLNCSDLTVSEIQSIYERYANYEEQIDLCMPRSRRGSMHWCKTLKDEGKVAKVKRARYKESIADSFGRYYKVNLTQIARRGAIEFRQHSGTTCFTKISNWLAFLMQFVESSCDLSQAQNFKKPQSSRPYAMIRNIIENENGTMEWSKRHRAWRVELNGNVCFAQNRKLNNLYDGNELLEDNTKDFLANWFGLLAPVLKTQTPSPRNIQTTDEGIFHGITQKVKDYLNERKEELA